MKKILYLTIILSSGLIVSCKKDKITSTPGVTDTTLNVIKDSIYYYAAEDYLWHTSLPTYSTFNPRSFTGSTSIIALQNELNKLSQYAINPATSQPYEYSANSPGTAKYSFIDDGSETAALNGTKGDFGFNGEYRTASDLRIEYVYPGSPAGLAGVKRGYQITAINGSTSISFDGTSGGVKYGDGSGKNLTFVNNAIFSSSTIAMTLRKPDSTYTTVNLTTTSYTVNPVLKDTVFNIGNDHVLGYLVFNSFTSDANADGVLNAAFADFASKGVTDLCIDLRYNGGGYVSTAEYLDNLIVPSSKSGSLMYNTYYSSNMAAGTDPLLKNQWRKDPSSGQDYNYGQINFSVAANAVNFSKKGSLNVNRVFFIITGSTASASELTINNLRPEMDVQFVGRTSYGKPVGFIDIDINKYTLFTPEFYTQNSTGQGGYYAGFTPGTTDYPGVNDLDDATKEFGDPNETLLAHVLQYVSNGSYTLSTAPGNTVQLSRAKTLALDLANPALTGLDNHKFTGMIFKRNLNIKR
jgi:carboxyl-terminal processing protease